MGLLSLLQHLFICNYAVDGKVYNNNLQSINVGFPYGVR